MRVPPKSAPWVVAALLAALLPLEQVGAQTTPWLGRLDSGAAPLTGAFGLTYMNGRQSSNASSASDSATNTLTETLQLSSAGGFYIISPLLFSGNLTINLGLDHDKSGGVVNQAADQAANQGRVLGYAFNGTILAEKPYTAALAANRNQLQMLQSSGAHVVGFTENRGITFQLHPDSIINDWGYPWFEARLALQQEKNQSTSSSFGRSLTTDEQGRTLTIDASKGFETADLALDLMFNERANAAFSQGNFKSSNGRLDYSLDFGPGLSRRFDSTLNMSDRGGVGPSSTVSASERLKIDHYQNLQSNYQYDLVRQSAGGISSTTQNVSTGLQHQLYKNLNTSLGLNASQSALPNGSASAYGTQFNQAYSHSLPGKGNLSVNWSGGYQLSSNQMSNSNVFVLDELHSAAPALITRTGFLLNHKFALPGSIKLWNIKGGGRTELFDASLVGPALADYEVKVEGNDVRIIPLPTSLRLNEGDPLAINYTYLVDAQLKSDTRSSGFGLGVDYRWIAASMGHSQSIQTPLNQGSAEFLQSQQQNFWQVNVKGRLHGLPAHAGLNVQRTLANNSDNDKTSFDSGIVWVPDYDLSLALDLKASRETYRLPDQHSTTTRSAQSAVRWPSMSLMVGLMASDSVHLWPQQYLDSARALNAALDWFTPDGWIHSASLEWGQHADGNRPAETLAQFMLKSNITLGKLSLNVNLAVGQWLRGSVRSNNRSFNASAVREF